MQKIEPQPRWEEDPSQDATGNWCGRYRCLQRGGNGEPSVGVEVDVIRPPSPDVRPVEVSRQWYWQPATRDKVDEP